MFVDRFQGGLDQIFCRKPCKIIAHWTRQ